MLKKEEVDFKDIKLMATRNDGMGVYQVGIAKRDNEIPIIVLSENIPSNVESLNLIPITSFLNFTDPDSLEWE
jgi:hypothetical protein